MQRKDLGEVGEVSLEPSWWDFTVHEKDFRGGPAIPWGVIRDGSDQVPVLRWARSLTTSPCLCGLIICTVFGGKLRLRAHIPTCQQLLLSQPTSPSQVCLYNPSCSEDPFFTQLLLWPPPNALDLAPCLLHFWRLLLGGNTAADLQNEQKGLLKWKKHWKLDSVVRVWIHMWGTAGRLLE